MRKRPRRGPNEQSHTNLQIFETTVKCVRAREQPEVVAIRATITASGGFLRVLSIAHVAVAYALGASRPGPTDVPAGAPEVGDIGATDKQLPLQNEARGKPAQS